jgi:uncharacterized cupin superfamily protein
MPIEDLRFVRSAMNLFRQVLRVERPREALKIAHIRHHDLHAGHAEEIVAGTPQARSLLLLGSDDGGLDAVLWDCTAGRIKITLDRDQIVHILEGEVTVHERDGRVHDLKAGDVAFLPLGAETEWHVAKYVRKLAVHRSPLALRTHLKQKLERAR